jgi:hypothetical protein
VPDPVELLPLLDTLGKGLLVFVLLGVWDWRKEVLRHRREMNRNEERMGEIEVEKAGLEVEKLRQEVGKGPSRVPGAC